MVHASYISNGNIYEVVKATVDDIDDDMIFALQGNVEVDEEYKERMKESVQQGLGYRLLKNGVRIGVMYNAVFNEEYTGCSLYCKDDKVGMIILLKSIFEVYDWHKLVLMPHEDGLKYFVSMATTGSIKEYHMRGLPLVISKKEVVDKGRKIFNYLGVEEING